MNATVPVTSRLVSASGLELPLRATDVRARARAGVASVVVEQTFENVHLDPFEVTYLLPLPVDAAVGGFRIRVGERVLVGEIAVREVARARYEEALLEGRTAGLLEQERTAVFRQVVGNVPPGAEVVVEVALDQPLAWEDGGWCWRLPTVVAPRYVDAGVADADRIAVDVADGPLPARLSLSLRVDDARTGPFASSSHALAVEGDVAALAGGRARLDRDVVVRWPVATPTPGLTLATGGHGGALAGLLTIVPPADEGQPVPRDLVVLLDASGSMGGAPLAQAVAVVSSLVEGLGDRDQLELIAFATDVVRWRPGATRADASARADARAWLASLRASGGTHMDAGIAAALGSLRPDAQRQVLLVSDGLIGFEDRVIARVRDALPAGSRVHVLGVGHGVNRGLTSPLARAGNGSEVIVAPDETVDTALRRLRAATEAPRVVDLQVDGSALVERPRRLPDVLAGAPCVVPLGLRPGTLRVRGRSATGVFEREVEVGGDVPDDGLPSRLLGRALVADLDVDRGTLARDVDVRIEALGLRFGIATSRTSFVAVDVAPTDDPTRPVRRVTVAQELPEGLSAEGLGLAGALPRLEDLVLMGERTAFLPMRSASPPPAAGARPTRRLSLRAPVPAARAAEEALSPERPTRFTVRVRSAVRRDGLLILTFEVPPGAVWTLPSVVRVVGRTGPRDADVEPSLTTGAAGAGDLVRLALVVPEDLGEVTLVRVRDLELEVRT